VTPRRALGLCAALLVATAARLPAQAPDSAAAMLQHGIQLYQDVEIEDALALLRQLVSPASTLAVSPEQRVQAYKYLGALFAMQPGAERHDSAVANFGAAIARDPAVDLDPQAFTPAQVAAFGEARNRTFAVAVRPLRGDTLDSTGVLTFRCVTSHAATLRAELRSDTTIIRVLFDGPYTGTLELTWDLTLGGGTPAPPGRYEMALIGRSSILNRTDSAAVRFDLAFDPPLQDTLPDLGPQDLLPETGTNNREITANVAENDRRRAERTANNAAIVQHNAEALRESKRVIVPVAGSGT